MTTKLKHIHAPIKPLQQGAVIECCECGATRRVYADRPPETWHTCKLCTHPWGLKGHANKEGA